MQKAAHYLPYLKHKEKFLSALGKARKEKFASKNWVKLTELKKGLLKICPADVKLISGQMMQITSGSVPNEQFRSMLNDIIMQLAPWRTGPFDLFNITIDSEWKSDLKWERLKPYLPDLKNKIIADIGCGNGYFMFRMLDQNPKIIYGIDPQPRCLMQFELLNSLINERRLMAVPIGIENMDLFYRYFDFVLCMGVIYHRRDPHTCLTKVRESIKPGGSFIIESLVVDAKGPYSFSPPDRYMKMRNVWFVPSVDCLCSWLEKAGFKNIKLLLAYSCGPEEQRRTKFSPDESYADFIDPRDSTKTIEGYDLPKRAIVRASA